VAGQEHIVTPQNSGGTRGEPYCHKGRVLINEHSAVLKCRPIDFRRSEAHTDPGFDGEQFVGAGKIQWYEIQAYY
jgi:hypothetical protein